MDKKLYVVTVTQYEWSDIMDPKPFSSLQKAIEYANMYGSYKDEYIARRFEDDEGYDENNWQEIKNINSTRIRSDYTYHYTISIDEWLIDDYAGLDED